MKMRLKYKLSFSYLIVSVVVIVSLLVTSNYLITRQFNQYVRTNMENNMMLLATQINLDLNRSQQETAAVDWERYGEVALDQGFVLTVHDSNEETLWCMACEYQEDCKSMLSTMEHTMHLVDPNFEGEYMEKHFDLIQQNQIVGTMVLGHLGPFHYNSSEVSFLTILQRVFFFGAFVFLVFAVVLGYVMAHHIAKPIDEVIGGTKRIARGNYKEFIDQKTSTIELNELITAVNQLGLSLENQQQIKRNMATDYAHEFRTPLAVLRSSLEGMMDGVWEVTPLRLQSLHEEIMRLTRMIEGIDQLVEVESHMLELNKTKFGIKAMVESLAINFAGELHEKALMLSIIGPEIEIMADADKIGQVIINLLSNAIKYNKPNTRITVSIRQTGKSAELEFCDQGIGISKEDLPFIFEHLYRADKSRQYEAGGKGIGLSIVQSIVHAHDGSVSVQSKLGEGSTFVVTLPLKG